MKIEFYEIDNELSSIEIPLDFFSNQESKYVVLEKTFNKATSSNCCIHIPIILDNISIEDIKQSETHSSDIKKPTILLFKNKV